MPILTKCHIDTLPVREKEYFVWDDQFKRYIVPALYHEMRDKPT